MMRRYIIEHPTRGVLKSLDETESGNQTGRFTVEGSRLSGLVFDSVFDAFSAVAQIRPERLRDGCQVRREPTDEEVQSPAFREDPWKVVTREDLVRMTIPNHIRVTAPEVRASVDIAVGQATGRLRSDAMTAGERGYPKLSAALGALVDQLTACRDVFFEEFEERGVNSHGDVL